jgi:hypothetical protein
VIGLVVCLTSTGAHADEQLAKAEDVLRTARYDDAIAYANKAFDSSKLSAGQTARALYVRGHANFKRNRPAIAISDLTSAIWTRQLPAPLLEKAKDMRTKAYAATGIAAPRLSAAKSEPLPPPRVSTQRSTATASATRQTGSAPPAPTHKVALPTAIKPRLPDGMQAARPTVASQPGTSAVTAQPTTTTPAWQTSSVRNLPAKTTWLGVSQKPAEGRRATGPLATAVAAGAVTTTGSIPQSTPVSRTPAQISGPAEGTAPAAPAPVFQTNVIPTEQQPTEPDRKAEPAGYGLFGGLFATTEPTSPDVALANELQRRRAEQIRAHNQRMESQHAATKQQ